MKHTLAFVNGQNTVPSRAYGHVRKDGTFVQADQSSTSATLGDGGIYSNLNDLAKWDEALRKNTLLSKSELAAALAPIRLVNGALPNWPAQPNERQSAPGQAGLVRLRLVSRRLQRPAAHVALRQHLGIPHGHPAFHR